VVLRGNATVYVAAAEQREAAFGDEVVVNPVNAVFL